MISQVCPSRQSFFSDSLKSLDCPKPTSSFSSVSPSSPSSPSSPLSPHRDREGIANDTPVVPLQAINGAGQFNRRTWEESKALYTLGLIPAHALLLDYLCLKLWRVGFSTIKLAVILAEEVGLTRSTLYRAIATLKKKLPGLFRFSRPLYKGKELAGDNRIRITRIGTLPSIPASLEPEDPEEETEEFDWNEEDLTGMITEDNLPPDYSADHSPDFLALSDRETVSLDRETARRKSATNSKPNPSQALPSPKNVDLLLDISKDLLSFSRTNELIEETEEIGGEAGEEAVGSASREEGRNEFSISSFESWDGESGEGLAKELMGGMDGQGGSESLSLSVSVMDSQSGSESDRPLVSGPDLGESVSLPVGGVNSQGGGESVSPSIGVKIETRESPATGGGKNPLERVRQTVKWFKGKGFGNTGSVATSPSADVRLPSDSYALEGVSSVRDNPMPQTLEAQTSPSNPSTTPTISDPREEEIKTLPPSFLRHPIVSRLSDSDRRSLWQYAVARCKELPNWSRDDRYPRIKSPTAWILSSLERIVYPDWCAVTSTVTVESLVRSSAPAAAASTEVVEGIVRPKQKPFSLAGKDADLIDFYLTTNNDYSFTEVPDWCFEKYPDRVHRFLSSTPTHHE